MPLASYADATDARLLSHTAADPEAFGGCGPRSAKRARPRPRGAREAGPASWPRPAWRLRWWQWRSSRARHPEQICLGELDRRRVHGQLQSTGGTACGWGIADIEAGLAGLGSEGSMFEGIVPDGVARVTVQFGLGHGAVTVIPINNIYVARLPRGVHVPARIVWRSADGAVIRSVRVP